MFIDMKTRLTALALVVLLALSVLSVSAAATEETLFERYIPINQAYSASVNPFSVTEGASYTFMIGTRFKDENKNMTFSDPLKRKDLQGYYFKLTYKGTFGALDKAEMMKAFSINENSYLLAMDDPSVERYANYHKLYGADTIIISIDLYDADKKFVQNVSPASAIMATGPDGEFLTFSMPQNCYNSIFFSTQDNILKPTEDRSSNSGRALHFTVEHLWPEDKGVAESLLASAGGQVEEFKYEFKQYPAVSGKKQYMTNNILSVNEFITPDNTYYQVGHKDGDIDPIVVNKIENVVGYSEYGQVLDAGYTRRSVLTADGTLYGVTTKYEKQVLAKDVKQAGKAHYLTRGGEVKEIIGGKTIATDCKAFAEHRYATVIAVLKNDDSCYLGYTYLAAENAYSKGLSKVLDKAKAVVAGGVCGADNKFYRWKEEVIRKGYDEAAWSRGEFIQYNDYQLSLELLTDNAVRVFPNEYFTAEQSTAEEAMTGFVVNSDGHMWAFGLQNMFDMGELGLIKHIFPIYQHKGNGLMDNGNFVGLLPEENSKPYGLVANHCSMNRPKVGQLPVDYLTDVPGGFKALDGYTYAFDNDVNDGSAGRRFKMKPTEFHYLEDKNELFKALDTSTNPVGNLILLPNVARSSYHADNQNGNTILLERTDGSMWMTQIYPRASASNIVAKLGGWECSNAIRITQPTTKQTATVDYVDLVSSGTISTLFNLGGAAEYPETSVGAPYITSDFYTQILPKDADQMYKDGKSFLLLICKQDCSYCKKIQPYMQTAIDREKIPVYGCLDENGSVQFYWDFVTGNTVGTPLFVLVKGKDDVEIYSSAYTNTAVDVVLAKAKAAGIAAGNTPTTPAEPAEKAKIPSDKLSVSEYEWEVLRIANRERHANGLPALSMPAALQDSCDIREKELVTLFDHTRPNGERPYTTIAKSFKHSYVGENIACGQTTPAMVMEAWMNSPGHRANILRDSFGYMGVGCLNERTKYWVQMFADVESYTSVTTSAGTMSFASEADMEKEYLVCTDKNGVVSYLPIDTTIMKKNGNAYSLALTGRTVALTVGEEKPLAFDDVKPTDWFAESVAWALKIGITVGTSETTFSPNATCTRAQIITFLWRALGSPKTGAANQFADVKPTDYYYESAIWANKMGMVTGITFDGNTPCTRASTVTYLWKNAGAPKTEATSVFTDVPANAEYAQAVAWALANKITNGTSETTFSPDNTCTRGQIVTFLKNTLK